MRSFAGRSGGMGSGGGGGILRTVQRAVRAAGGVGGGATSEPFSNTSTVTRRRRKQTCQNKSNAIKLNSSSPSSSSSSSHNSSSPFSPAPSWTEEEDEGDGWEHVDDGYIDEVVFGSVPSVDEVHHAVSALQQKMGVQYSFSEPTSFSLINKEATESMVGPESDWIEPAFCNPEALKPCATADRVYDAFHLLNTEPSVQRMVISLSSDKAIWNAVLNNEVVREFRDSLNQGLPGSANTKLSGSAEDGEGDGSAKDILSWIVVNIKTRVTELLDKIGKLVNEVFHPSKKTTDAAENVDPFEERLRASFLLSVVVLLIVVVTRAGRVA